MNKNIFKKVLGFVLSAAAAVSSLCIGAEAYDFYPSSEDLRSGKEYSVTLDAEGDTYVYKAEVTDKGVLTVKLIFRTPNADLTVVDSDGSPYAPYDYRVRNGLAAVKRSGIVNAAWSPEYEMFSGTFSYAVDKGTYYITISKSTIGVGGDFSVTADFPSRNYSEPRFNDDDAVSVDDDSPTVSDKSAHIESVIAELKVGRSVNMKKLLDIKDKTKKKITWYSTDKSIVTVSSDGRIMAKSAGTAIVTVRVGSSRTAIYITVTE